MKIRILGASTRAEAVAAGLTTYFTGKPCKHGHIASRRVENRCCEECGRIRNREHIRGNPEANRVITAAENLAKGNRHAH